RRLRGPDPLDRQGDPPAGLAAAARSRGDVAGHPGGLPGPLRGTRRRAGREVARGRGRSAARAMKLAVVIPAYNAGRHLPGVVSRILAHRPPGLARVIVVDDGSADDTDVVARSLAAPTP